MRSLGRLAPADAAQRSSCPPSLPSFFSGLRVAATVSVIGAVFGEWAGADEGLGRLVLLGNNQLQTPRVYAGIVLLTLMAVALFALVALAERVPVPGTERKRPRESTLAAADRAACAVAPGRRLRREGGRARRPRARSGSS